MGLSEGPLGGRGLSEGPLGGKGLSDGPLGGKGLSEGPLGGKGLSDGPLGGNGLLGESEGLLAGPWCWFPSFLGPCWPEGPLLGPEPWLGPDGRSPPPLLGPDPWLGPLLGGLGPPEG